MCVQIKPIPQEIIDEIIREVEANRPINLMPDWPAVRPSAFPKAQVGLITCEKNHLVSSVKKWGYEVSWNKNVIANTRDDSALDPDKMWFDSLLNRRCVVPTFGFYEPHRSEKTISKQTGKPIKQQYFFKLRNSPITFIAGIFEDDHFSLMTTKPSKSIKPIHDRMPMVLLQEELQTWLSGDFIPLFDRSSICLDAMKA